LDYASAAVEIAWKTLKENLADDLIPRCGIQQSDAKVLPFADDTVDRVFMLDVVEHLTPLELSATFQEVYRILKPGGKLIVHTMPSLWYYRYGYPLFRAINKLRKIESPVDPRARCDFSHFHVNEQTPLSLRKVLRESGFQTRVWLKTTQDYEYEKNRLVRWGMKFLVSAYPFRWIFCNDIFAIGKKRDG
jgi:predicted SAM-dependent methyltransferase